MGETLTMAEQITTGAGKKPQGTQLQSSHLNQYGHFSEDGAEFVITNPITPRPWINYLTNEEYCAVISHNAGGYSFYRDCRIGRLTRWAPENYHLDRPGRFIYVRDQETGEYWSATYQPIRKEPQYYQSCHGLGYTKIQTTYSQIEFEGQYFVPVKDPCEIWLCRVKNSSDKTRRLELYPYVEWFLGDYHMELRYRNIMVLYNRVWWDRTVSAILAKKTAFWENLDIKPFPFLAFFASSLPVQGVATQKDGFLGRYNTEEKPQAIVTGQWRDKDFCSGEDSIGVLRHPITLAPGESKEFSVILGERPADTKKIQALLDHYKDVTNAKIALEETKSLWKKRILDNITIKTPDLDFDRMVNIWVKYQLYICNFWSRSPSYFHEGSGGRGYRDSCQDAEATVSINPEHARQKIETLVRLIREDGSCAPGWNDTICPAEHRPNKDHPVWLTYTVSAYIKESGNKKILLKKFPYLKDRWIKKGWHIDPAFKGGPRWVGSGTLYEHLKRNLEFTWNDVGKRGLPLIGHADWNDAIDAAGKRLKGESVWLAQSLVRSLKTLADLAELMSKTKDAEQLRKKAQTMTERINRLCWDGDWYLRGFTDVDTVYGSKKNKEGKIFLNTQSWAILAGVAPQDRLEKLLKAMDRYLDGPHGYALFFPAYSKYDAKLGRISMFTEGTKENAAVFCHAATFAIVGLCMMGQGDRAYRAMKKLMPNAQKDYDLYKTEPYVYAEYMAGPQHPYQYGEGAFTWVTGTAGWNFMAATEWLMGAQRDFRGLRIDPCIPSHWKRCQITRPFRGAIYDITIENPKGVQKGIGEIYLDGVKHESNLLIPKEKRRYEVRVILG